MAERMWVGIVFACLSVLGAVMRRVGNAGAAERIEMGRSFYLGTDAELYTKSDAFAAKIASAPDSYGLTLAQASAYGGLNGNYASAYLRANDPETRTKATVAAKNTARDALKKMASRLAKIIEGTSTVTDSMKIDLGLSVRKTPAPRGDPGTPMDFSATLNGDGALILKWKCKNPVGTSGTLYQVYRQIGNEQTYLGGSGERSFTDGTIPNGTSNVTYKVQAVRSTSAGMWGQFNVGFGVGASNEPIVNENASVKIAA